jgi:hypothetical protein
MSITSVDDQLSTNGNYLLQNYPNPVNGKTRIEYGVGENSKVYLSVYGIDGQMKMVIVDKVQQRGTYQVELNTQLLDPGVYFYRIQIVSDNQSWTETKKLIVKGY